MGGAGGSADETVEDPADDAAEGTAGAGSRATSGAGDDPDPDRDRDRAPDCPRCGAALTRRHCKYICPRHGVIMDCSDTFW